MTWSWLNWAYTFCLTVGTGYTVLAFLLGHVGGGDSGHDGGGDMGGDAPEVGGNVGEIGADHTMHFPLLSPIAIAVFLTAFGAGGLIGGELLKGAHPAASLGPALGGGLFFGLSMAWLMMWVFKRTISTSQARESDILGAEALVIVTIPPAGVGKISYEAAGTRFTSPARSAQGQEIRQEAKVTIRARDGAVLLVDVK